MMKMEAGPILRAVEGGGGSSTGSTGSGDARAPDSVIGPLGLPITLADLPPPDTSRWVIRRKAEVVAAVNGGLLTIDEVLARYGLTLEEFAGWQRGFDRSGMLGLRVTHAKQYRDRYQRQMKY